MNNNFTIYKKLITDWSGNEGLAIRIDHTNRRHKWKNRLLWFSSETTVYKKHKNEMKGQTK